jgi:hypothetical protein
MPRRPTGTPRGRRLGIGDEAPRLTVRFPPAVFARLQAFVDTATGPRGAPRWRCGCGRWSPSASITRTFSGSSARPSSPLGHLSDRRKRVLDRRKSS